MSQVGFGQEKLSPELVSRSFQGDMILHTKGVGGWGQALGQGKPLGFSNLAGKSAQWAADGICNVLTFGHPLLPSRACMDAPSPSCIHQHAPKPSISATTLHFPVQP